MRTIRIVSLICLLLLQALIFGQAFGNGIPPAQIDGLVSDSAVDMDGDGANDMLIAVVNIDIEEPGYYLLTADLTFAGGSTLETDSLSSVSAHSFEIFWICGPQQDVPVPLAFLSKDVLRNSRADEFTLAAHLVKLSIALDSVVVDSSVFRLSGYDFASFEDYSDEVRIRQTEEKGAQESAAILGVSCDGVVDANADGYYDFLLVSVDVDVRRAGYFFISAFISAEDGTRVCDRRHSLSTNSGLGQATLCPVGVNRFHVVGSGQQILESGKNGTFVLNAALCVQGTGEVVDSIRCELSSYRSDQFKEWGMEIGID